MLCRNRALERSLEAWQEKQQRYSQQPVAGQHGKVHSPALSEEENQTLISFLEATTALVRSVSLREEAEDEENKGRKRRRRRK